LTRPVHESTLQAICGWSGPGRLQEKSAHTDEKWMETRPAELTSTGFALESRHYFFGEERMATVALLTLSNIFMTFAWYGHLKYKSSPLWIAIGISWMIALVEYCFQVPANRIGHSYFSLVQLKTIQEVITLVVFCFFSVLYMKEAIRWNHLVGFLCIIGAVFFIFKE
jgi:uncharacterized protein (DUF486 family)